MRHRLLATVTAIAFLLGLVPGAALAADPEPAVSLPVARPVNPNYAAIKAAIDARAPTEGLATTPTLVTAPSVVVSWRGLGPNGFSPSDATGAISPDRYIELVNSQIGVYDRNGTLLSQNSEGTWTGFGSAASGDGQIMWDTRDQRFYYAMLFIRAGSRPTNQLAFGFSKTATPSANAADWCSYHSTFGSYGSDFPDYPKLGQTSDFLLIGVNRFNSAGTIAKGSDVAWVTKPAPGPITTCPALNTLRTGVQRLLLNADGSQAFTPVPGRQTDVAGTGYVVANKDAGAGTANILSVYQVTKDTSTGKPIFSAPITVNVPAYAYPPSAPQPGTNFKLDTLDARLTNAWLAPDPNHGGALALWTQHTVAASAGGLGAEERWYEIDPTTGSLFQSGIVQSPSLYVFMGAISPDRNGTTGQFGGSMVLAFNTSSSTSLPAAQMVSKVGSNPQSGFVLVATSPRADKDFTCSSSTPCRWGDYAGASPDPAATASGEVWVSIMLANGGNAFSPGWTTQNWAATP